MVSEKGEVAESAEDSSEDVLEPSVPEPSEPEAPAKEASAEEASAPEPSEPEPSAAAQPASSQLPADTAERLEVLSAQASVPPPTRPSVALGLTLHGRYRIDGRLGVGGVGAVYAGTQLALGRKVAIKLLHEGLDPSFRARFEREARALASLRHPNVVSITDFGVDDETPYLVMELLEGDTLGDRLRRGRLLPEHALELSRQLLRALAFVHEQGLVHRDLKPGNLFLELTVEGEERLKLLDFGLAKYVDNNAQGEGQTVTHAGHVVGTPAYMAPEQIAGEVPSLRDSLPAEFAPRPELMALIDRVMRKKRDERFGDALEMLAALEAVPQPWLIAPGLLPETIVPVSAAERMQAARAKTKGRPSERRGHGWIVAAVLAMGLLVLVVRGSENAEPRATASPPDKPAPPEQPVQPLPSAVPSTAPIRELAAPPPLAGAAAPLLPPGMLAARNPWTKDTPTELRVIRKKVTSGEHGDERMITTLRQYNQATEHDARGHLLLARMYLNRGWGEDALKQFELVCQVDPSARGAPLMLGDLLGLVANPKTSRDAIRLVQRAYGREALPTLDAQLMMPASDPAADARLRALRAALIADGS